MFSTRRPLRPLLVAALLLASPALRAQEGAPAAAVPADAAPTPPPAPPASADLLLRLDAVEQEARIANRKLELLDEAAATKKKEAPTVSADEKGFGISSADKSNEIKFHGLVQIDGRRHMDTQDPALADKDTLLPRRIRPILDGTVLGLADFRIMPDFGNGTTALLDAYIDAHPRPWLRFRAGKFKPPIGLERLQNDAYLPLIERSLDSNLTPQRDVGLQLWGDVLNSFLRYEIGLYNGAADGASTDLDNNHAKSYGGRLFLRPFQLGDLKSLGDLGVGFAVLTGNDKGTPAASAVSAFRSAGQNTIFSYLTTDAATTVYAWTRHTRINPELYYYVGPFGLLAEWVREYQVLGKGPGVPPQTGAVNNDSAHVTVSFVIGGDETYEGAKPRKNANWATKDLGAIELAARYNYVNTDNVAFEGSTLADPSKSVTKAQGFALGVSWWLSRNLRAMGNYERTTFEGGNSTGSGAAKVITNRATENMLIGRFQVMF